MAQCFRLGGSVAHPLIGRYASLAHKWSNKAVLTALLQVGKTTVREFLLYMETRYFRSCRTLHSGDVP